MSEFDLVHRLSQQVNDLRAEVERLRKERAGWADVSAGRFGVIADLEARLHSAREVNAQLLDSLAHHSTVAAADAGLREAVDGLMLHSPVEFDPDNRHHYCIFCDASSKGADSTAIKHSGGCAWEACRAARSQPEQWEAKTVGGASLSDGATTGPVKMYPCSKCGKLRTAAEGGTTFTVCDECWDKSEVPSPTAVPAEGEAAQDADVSEMKRRLLDACKGHPYALIPWPHRLLHEAREMIERLSLAPAPATPCADPVHEKAVKLAEAYSAWTAEGSRTPLYPLRTLLREYEAARDAARGETGEGEAEKIVTAWEAECSKGKMQPYYEPGVVKVSPERDDLVQRIQAALARARG